MTIVYHLIMSSQPHFSPQSGAPGAPEIQFGDHDEHALPANPYANISASGFADDQIVDVTTSGDAWAAQRAASAPPVAERTNWPAPSAAPVGGVSPSAPTGQPHLQAQPHTQAPPQAQAAQAQPQPKKGLAITAFVLGLVSSLAWILPIIGGIIALLAVLFGVFALLARQSKAFSIIGLIFGALALVAQVVLTVSSLMSVA